MISTSILQARLFVALDFPPLATAALVGLQPPPCAGLRLISAGQMHLTLHFIGQAAIASTADALQTVRARSFVLRLAGLGQFRARAGVTLWAGVEANDGLLALHGAISAALAGAAVADDLRHDLRPYQPHITLARGKSALPAEVLRRFLMNAAATTLPEAAVRDFALYSSTPGREGPMYRCEQRFDLTD